MFIEKKLEEMTRTKYHVYTDYFLLAWCDKAGVCRHVTWSVVITLNTPECLQLPAHFPRLRTDVLDDVFLQFDVLEYFLLRRLLLVFSVELHEVSIFAEMFHLLLLMIQRVCDRLGGRHVKKLT